MAERHRAIRHKYIKKLIAAGKYDEARNALLGARDAHLVLLETERSNTDKAELLLTLDYALLAECDSLDGREDDADMWFDKALRHYADSHDPMVMQRILRVRGMHHARCGRFEDAEADLDSVIATLHSKQFAMASMLPAERIELEFAFTQSRLAECRLMQLPGDAAAIALVLGMMPVLRVGSKRRYELENLMVCIAVTNQFTSPVKFASMTARAAYINAVSVHCADHAYTLMDAVTPLPTGSILRSVAGRLG